MAYDGERSQLTRNDAIVELAWAALAAVARKRALGDAPQPTRCAKKRRATIATNQAALLGRDAAIDAGGDQETPARAQPCRAEPAKIGARGTTAKRRMAVARRAFDDAAIDA